MSHETVTLKNGSAEVAGAVSAIMASLRHVFTDDPLAAYDLVMKCRDTGYEPFGNAAQRLNRYALMDLDGRVHDTVRNVILSAVTGDGMDMTIDDPREIAPELTATQ